MDKYWEYNVEQQQQQQQIMLPCPQEAQSIYRDDSNESNEFKMKIVVKLRSKEDT